ncbi:unnamed protein product, partial [Brenthis ino]
MWRSVAVALLVRALAVGASCADLQHKMALNFRERNEYIQKNNLCYNCLHPGHSVKKCRLQMSCRICHKRHHSLLHQPSKSNTLDQSEKQAQPTVSVYANVEESEGEEINAMMTSHYNGRQSSAMLATAEVKAKSEEGNIIMLRALIDQGSEASFISEKAAQLLKLSRQPARGNVVGMGSTRTSVNQRVQLQVSPRWESQFSIHIQAYVISKQLRFKIHLFLKRIQFTY